MIELASSLLTPAVLLSAAGGVIAYAFHLYMDQRTKQLQIFNRYSEKYSEIMATLARNGSFTREFDHESSTDREYAMRLFFLLSEEMYLSRRGLIKQEVWEIWASGIEKMMDKRFFQGAWSYCCQEVDLEGEFRSLIEASMCASPEKESFSKAA